MRCARKKEADHKDREITTMFKRSKAAKGLYMYHGMVSEQNEIMHILIIYSETRSSRTLRVQEDFRMSSARATVCYHRSPPNRSSAFIINDGQNVLAVDISGQMHRVLPIIVLENRRTMVHLIADDNLLNEHSFDIPAFPMLKTLSLDVNRVRDVPTLLYNLRRSCPNLTSLSIIGNPGWTVVCNRSHRLNKQYRNAAQDMLPLLQSLDAKTTFKTRRKSSISSGSTISSILTLATRKM
ncbi:unnamed protein product [Cylicocyclus nassatus]|uniref:Uncharacterized protein n=1 Tax=Cylicocyclus nassatus TaxID=53992 RepID=A0AA36GQC6_CYLNA|nr:unnamed protein product [Cylicocyclus nassatus]